MKTTLTHTLAMAAISLGFASMTALADSNDKATHSASHATRLTSIYKPGDSASTKTNQKTKPALASPQEPGFTTGVGSNPADHGINNSTATHPGDNGINSGVGTSNDIKGSSTAVPTVNSADLNSKAGKGVQAATEKK